MKTARSILKRVAVGLGLRHASPQRSNSHSNQPTYSGSWLIMDRPDKGKDNAEVLFRHCLENTSRRAFFVLRTSSSDWKRLADAGFGDSLIAYGSEAHKKAMQSCDLLISSQADYTIAQPPFRSGKVDLSKVKFVFLQHGVTHNDISSWLNRRELKIQLMACGTADEMEFLGQEGSQFLISKKELRLTGFPRWDFLDYQHQTESRKILIVPTWRLWLQNSSEKELEKSQFVREWKSLLSSKALREYAADNHLELVLLLHPLLMSASVWQKRSMSHITLSSFDDIEEFHSLVNESAFFITDYSSIAFDFGYAYKPTIYFQFDRKRISERRHTWTFGSFDARTDGFGPCISSAKQLEDALSQISQFREAREESPILARFQVFRRDEKNAVRVFKAIEKEFYPTDF